MTIWAILRVNGENMDASSWDPKIIVVGVDGSTQSRHAARCRRRDGGEHVRRAAHRDDRPPSRGMVRSGRFPSHGYRARKHAQ